MRIRFQFNAEAAVQAAAYLLGNSGGAVDKVKLTKLLYLADVDHFLQYGRPITGDTQSALPFGPVPSCTLNLLNGLDDQHNDYVLAYIGSGDRQFILREEPGTSCLTQSDKTILDAVLKQYGDMHTWALRDLTHKLPEYVECEVPGSSSPIPYETILKHHGGASGFRSNRPVISPAVAANMLCPFRESEPDL